MSQLFTREGIIAAPQCKCDQRDTRLKGAAHEIRFADDAVLCFQYREDAEKVMEVLPKRFARYGLTLHPGEDTAGALWAIRGGTCETAGEETSHVLVRSSPTCTCTTCSMNGSSTIVCPCPVPVSLTSNRPSSMTPT
jgi:hypothetical protein